MVSQTCPTLITQAEYPGQGTIQAWAPVPASLLGTGDLVHVTSLPESRFLTHLPMGTLKTKGGSSRRLCHWHLAQRWVPEPLRVEGTSSARSQHQNKVTREHRGDTEAMKLVLGWDGGRGGGQRDPAPLIFAGAKVEARGQPRQAHCMETSCPWCQARAAVPALHTGRHLPGHSRASHQGHRP